MKKIKYLRLLTLVLAFTMLLGCGSAESSIPQEEVVLENDFTIPTFPTDFVVEAVGEYADDETDDDTDALIPAGSFPVEELELLYTDVVANDFIPVRYVMIYNPRIHDTYDTVLSTGSIGNQVEVDLNKGGLEEPITYLGASQDELSGDVPLDELIQEGSRAGTIITPYQVGDTRDFYCYDNISLDNGRISRNFTCRYAGTYCNIWTSGTDMSESLIEDYGDQFDNYIYNSVVTTFGQPRFSKNGGKVNLLYYPMPSNIGGCFCMWDLFARDEVLASEITAYGLNTDHDILHINADLTSYDYLETFMRSTMAHEFQHLICATNTFETPDLTVCPTWFNEAMSGYIEEVLYPGVKSGSGGHLTAFLQSDLVRNGQSLYTFTTETDDIGVYGSVYLYSEYLAELAGDDVFSRFHKYWRSSYSSTLSGPEAILNAVPKDVYQVVHSCTPYPKNIAIDTADETWMSKLTLQFHLELLNREANDPDAFSTIDARDLVYNQINPASIEGGGRIIVALQDDVFVVPQDADKGLFYIGLDKDFNPVTALIYN